MKQHHQARLPALHNTGVNDKNFAKLRMAHLHQYNLALGTLINKVLRFTVYILKQKFIQLRLYTQQICLESSRSALPIL